MTSEQDPKIIISGTSGYWNQVVAHMLETGGMKTEVLHSRPHGPVFKWFLTDRGRQTDLFYLVCPTGNWLVTLPVCFSKKPCIIHWIGSDVPNFLHGKCSRGWRNRILRKLIDRKGPLVHLADSPVIRDELLSAGIDSKVVHLIPPRVRSQPQPLPSEHRVLSYWQDRTKDFFNGDLVLRLAREFPAVPFRITGADGKNVEAPPNVEFLGFVKDIEPVYRDCSVLIRMPEHDSIGMMVVEMLARGRYVLYSKPFEHCQYVRTYEEAKAALAQVLRQTKPNLSGAEYIQTHFSFDQESQKMEAICQELLRGGPAGDVAGNSNL